MLGDSITAGCEWRELFRRNDVYNRGIGNDTTVGVLHRISTVTRMRPSAVFLMIGTNDAQTAGLSPEESAQNIRLIIQRIHTESPGTHVYLESLLPSKQPKKNLWVSAANKLLRNVAGATGAEWVDLYPLFAIPGTDVIQDQYTVDGLHLSAEGYDVWLRRIRPALHALGRTSDPRTPLT